MFVVIWEPKYGHRGGGHQLVSDRHRADDLARRLIRERPGDSIQVLTAQEHSAAAVLERQGRRRASGR